MHDVFRKMKDVLTFQQHFPSPENELILVFRYSNFGAVWQGRGMHQSASHLKVLLK